MKLLARILLFLFIVFLSAPTIVTLIKKSSSTAIFFNFSEEEKAHKEVKIVDYDNETLLNTIILISKDNKSCLILSENLSKHDLISASIFVPPPLCS